MFVQCRTLYRRAPPVQNTAMDARATLLEEIDAEMRETARWTGRDRLSPRVQSALAKVNRAGVGPVHRAGDAWLNVPLPIGQGQTISQPFIVALMSELLDLQHSDKVLEIGTGSGYQAAVLAELAGEVCSIEVLPALAERAAKSLADQGYGNVKLRTGDGARGWPEEAPFDAVIVTAAAPGIPPALIEQLREGGRLIAPVGPPHDDQELVLMRKQADGKLIERRVLSVAFVPLTGG